MLDKINGVLWGPAPDLTTMVGVSGRGSLGLTASVSVQYAHDNSGNRAVFITVGAGYGSPTANQNPFGIKKFKNISAGASVGGGIYTGQVSDWSGYGENKGASAYVGGIDISKSGNNRGVFLSRYAGFPEFHTESTYSFMIPLPRDKSFDDPWLIQ